MTAGDYQLYTEYKGRVKSQIEMLKMTVDEMFRRTQVRTKILRYLECSK